MTTGSVPAAVPVDPVPFRARFRRVLLRVLLKALLLAAVSLLLGGSTSFAQAVLPVALLPLANSASGWTVPTALLVWALRERAGVSAVFGVVAFECLVLGYVVASQLRGIPDQESLFLIVGVAAGPVVGIAAAWLRRPAWRPAIGAGVLAGVLLGESVWGLTVIPASTGWLVWSVFALIGTAALLLPAIHGARRLRRLLLTAAVAACTAVALLAVYAVLG